MTLWVSESHDLWILWLLYSSVFHSHVLHSANCNKHCVIKNHILPYSESFFMFCILKTLIEWLEVKKHWFNMLQFLMVFRNSYVTDFCLMLDRPNLYLFWLAKICGEDGQVDPNCFVIAQSVVFSIIDQQWVTLFLMQILFIFLHI